MDKPIKSVLTFDNYIVRRILFEANPDFKPNEKITVEMGFSHEFEFDLDQNVAAVCLGCNIFKERNENYPFSLEIEIVGFFKFETTLESEEAERLLKVNGTAILFPYLRSIVSSLTADSGFQPLILPVMNIHKMLP